MNEFDGKSAYDEQQAHNCEQDVFLNLMIDDPRTIKTICRDHFYLPTEKELDQKFKLIDEAIKKLRPMPSKTYRLEWLAHKAEME